MPISVDVYLMSGKMVSLEVEGEASVNTLRLRAQSALGVGNGRLLNSFGRLLPERATIAEAKLQSGDVLTLRITQVLLAASKRLVFVHEAAFAKILGDGSVVTWGDSECGGDSSAVQDRLKDVQQIQASGHAFAAILENGSVVTWGDASCGGHFSSSRDPLKDVREIKASQKAFAAILWNGSVVTWGDSKRGGDSRAVQDQLKDVRAIQCSCAAFAAILETGSALQCQARW
ncbi:FTSH1 [Symbiodinium necroappetens]|uniref:FTSH1 protein n=1 Tax=Symbiodinium necroappetens TaxID=1628268 RepID=A0A812XSD9_9DINO|nr:FTSH1 [Symbiodinium necroappetens]